MNALSKRQVNALECVWSDLWDAPEAEGPPQTDNAVCLARLDAWLAGVISGHGHVSEQSLQDLLDLADEAKSHLVARRYVDWVVELVMPHRTDEPPRYSAFAEIVRDHCEARGNGASGGERDRFGYRNWDIKVPNRKGRARLSISGEVVLLDLTGGFTWTECGYSKEEVEEALAHQLRLLDAYADPATRVISAKRFLRPGRTELHISDGAVLWRGAGRNSRPRTSLTCRCRAASQRRRSR